MSILGPLGTVAPEIFKVGPKLIKMPTKVRVSGKCLIYKPYSSKCDPYHPKLYITLYQGFWEFEINKKEATVPRGPNIVDTFLPGVLFLVISSMSTTVFIHSFEKF